MSCRSNDPIYPAVFVKIRGRYYNVTLLVIMAPTGQQHRHSKTKQIDLILHSGVDICRMCLVDMTVASHPTVERGLRLRCPFFLCLLAATADDVNCS